MASKTVGHVHRPKLFILKLEKRVDTNFLMRMRHKHDVERSFLQGLAKLEAAVNRLYYYKYNMEGKVN